MQAERDHLILILEPYPSLLPLLRTTPVSEQPLSPEEAKEAGIYSPNPTVPICKLIDKKAAYNKQKEIANANKAKKQSGQMEEKEIQLTWGVSLNDLTHKLRKAKDTLRKGGRIALVVTAPSRSRAPPKEERQLFIDMCKSQLGQEEGKFTIWKAEEWIGSKTSVYLTGVRAKI